MNRLTDPNNLAPQCCPEPKSTASVTNSLTKIHHSKTYVPESFLPASYFLLMLLALGNFPQVMQSMGVDADSSILFAIGLWAINAIVFCVVSFLYYSEGEESLKKLFANMRIISLSSYPVLFWWALYNHSGNVNPYEWSVVFGFSATLFLLFSGFVLRLQQKQIITSYLFLASALLCYAGIMQAAVGNMTLSSLLLASGVISLMAFALQTQTLFRLKCQHVEVLLMLSLIVQWLAISLI